MRKAQLSTTNMQIVSHADNGVDNDDPFITCHQCHVVTKFSESKPIFSANGQESGERICYLCQKENVKNTSKCPLLSCPSLISQNTKFRTLPSKFYEIPDGPFKRKIIDHFGINRDTKACCNLCYNKLSKVSSVAKSLGEGEDSTSTPSPGGEGSGSSHIRNDGARELSLKESPGSVKAWLQGTDEESYDYKLESQRIDNVYSSKNYDGRSSKLVFEERARDISETMKAAKYAHHQAARIPRNDFPSSSRFNHEERMNFPSKRKHQTEEYTDDNVYASNNKHVRLAGSSSSGSGFRNEKYASQVIQNEESVTPYYNGKNKYYNGTKTKTVDEINVGSNQVDIGGHTLNTRRKFTSTSFSTCKNCKRVFSDTQEDGTIKRAKYCGRCIPDLCVVVDCKTPKDDLHLIPLPDEYFALTRAERNILKKKFRVHKNVKNACTNCHRCIMYALHSLFPSFARVPVTSQPTYTMCQQCQRITPERLTKTILDPGDNTPTVICEICAELRRRAIDEAMKPVSMGNKSHTNVHASVHELIPLGRKAQMLGSTVVLSPPPHQNRKKHFVEVPMPTSQTQVKRKPGRPPGPRPPGRPPGQGRGRGRGRGRPPGRPSKVKLQIPQIVDMPDGRPSPSHPNNNHTAILHPIPAYFPVTRTQIALAPLIPVSFSQSDRISVTSQSSYSTEIPVTRSYTPQSAEIPKSKSYNPQFAETPMSKSYTSQSADIPASGLHSPPRIDIPLTKVSTPRSIDIPAPKSHTPSPVSSPVAKSLTPRKNCSDTNKVTTTPRKTKMTFHHPIKGPYEVSRTFKKNKKILGPTASIKLGTQVTFATCDLKFCKESLKSQQVTSFSHLWGFCSRENARQVKRDFKIDEENNHFCCYSCFNELQWYLAFLNGDIGTKPIPAGKSQSKMKRFHICEISGCKDISDNSFKWVQSYDDLLLDCSQDIMDILIKKFYVDPSGRGFCCTDCMYKIKEYMLTMVVEKGQKKQTSEEPNSTSDKTYHTSFSSQESQSNTSHEVTTSLDTVKEVKHNGIGMVLASNSVSTEMKELDMISKVAASETSSEVSTNGSITPSSANTPPYSPKLAISSPFSSGKVVISSSLSVTRTSISSVSVESTFLSTNIARISPERSVASSVPNVSTNGLSPLEFNRLSPSLIAYSTSISTNSSTFTITTNASNIDDNSDNFIYPVVGNVYSVPKTDNVSFSSYSINQTHVNTSYDYVSNTSNDSTDIFPSILNVRTVSSSANDLQLLSPVPQIISVASLAVPDNTLPTNTPTLMGYTTQLEIIPAMNILPINDNVRARQNVLIPIQSVVDSTVRSTTASTIHSSTVASQTYHPPSYSLDKYARTLNTKFAQLQPVLPIAKNVPQSKPEDASELFAINSIFSNIKTPTSLSLHTDKILLQKMPITPSSSTPTNVTKHRTILPHTSAPTAAPIFFQDIMLSPVSAVSNTMQSPPTASVVSMVTSTPNIYYLYTGSKDIEKIRTSGSMVVSYRNVSSKTNSQIEVTSTVMHGMESRINAIDHVPQCSSTQLGSNGTYITPINSDINLLPPPVSNISSTDVTYSSNVSMVVEEVPTSAEMIPSSPTKIRVEDIATTSLQNFRDVSSDKLKEMDIAKTVISSAAIVSSSKVIASMLESDIPTTKSDPSISSIVTNVKADLMTPPSSPNTQQIVVTSTVDALSGIGNSKTQLVSTSYDTNIHDNARSKEYSISAMSLIRKRTTSTTPPPPRHKSISQSPVFMDTDNYNDIPVEVRSPVYMPEVIFCPNDESDSESDSPYLVSSTDSEVIVDTMPVVISASNNDYSSSITNSSDIKSHLGHAMSSGDILNPSSQSTVKIISTLRPTMTTCVVESSLEPQSSCSTESIVDGSAVTPSNNQQFVAEKAAWKHDKPCQTEFSLSNNEIWGVKPSQCTLVSTGETTQRTNHMMTVKLDKICQTGLVYASDSRDKCSSSTLKEAYSNLPETKFKNAVRREAKDLYDVFMKRLNELTLGCGREILSEFTHPKEQSMVSDYKKIIQDQGELYKKTDRKNKQERLRLLSTVALHAPNDLIRTYFQRYTTKGDLVSVNEDEIKQARDYARQFGTGIPLPTHSPVSSSSHTSITSENKDASKVSTVRNINPSLPGCLVTWSSLHNSTKVSLHMDTSSYVVSSCGTSLKTSLKLSLKSSSQEDYNVSTARHNTLVTESKAYEIDRNARTSQNEQIVSSPVYEVPSIDFNCIPNAENSIDLMTNNIPRVSVLPYPHIATTVNNKYQLVSKDSSLIDTGANKWVMPSKKKNVSRTEDNAFNKQLISIVEETSDGSKRKRKKFSQIEKNTLEYFYSEIVTHGKKKSIEEIQNVLNLDKQTINTWFRNRKCKEKKEELGRSLKYIADASKSGMSAESNILDSDDSDSDMNLFSASLAEANKNIPNTLVEEEETENVSDNVERTISRVDDDGCDGDDSYDEREESDDNLVMDIDEGMSKKIDGDERAGDNVLLEETIIEYLHNESQLVTDTEDIVKKNTPDYNQQSSYEASSPLTNTNTYSQQSPFEVSLPSTTSLRNTSPSVVELTEVTPSSSSQIQTNYTETIAVSSDHHLENSPVGKSVSITSRLSKFIETLPKSIGSLTRRISETDITDSTSSTALIDELPEDTHHDESTVNIESTDNLYTDITNKDSFNKLKADILPDISSGDIPTSDSREFTAKVTDAVSETSTFKVDNISISVTESEDNTTNSISIISSENIINPVDVSTERPSSSVDTTEDVPITDKDSEEYNTPNSIIKLSENIVNPVDDSTERLSTPVDTTENVPIDLEEDNTPNSITKSSENIVNPVDDSTERPSIPVDSTANVPITADKDSGEDNTPNSISKLSENIVNPVDDSTERPSTPVDSTANVPITADKDSGEDNTPNSISKLSENIVNPVDDSTERLSTPVDTTENVPIDLEEDNTPNSITESSENIVNPVDYSTERPSTPVDTTGNVPIDSEEDNTPNSITKSSENIVNLVDDSTERPSTPVDSTANVPITADKDSEEDNTPNSISKLSENIVNPVDDSTERLSTPIDTTENVPITADKDSEEDNTPNSIIKLSENIVNPVDDSTERLSTSVETTENVPITADKDSEEDNIPNPIPDSFKNIVNPVDDSTDRPSTPIDTSENVPITADKDSDKEITLKSIDPSENYVPSIYDNYMAPTKLIKDSLEIVPTEFENTVVKENDSLSVLPNKEDNAPVNAYSNSVNSNSASLTKKRGRPRKEYPVRSSPLIERIPSFDAKSASDIDNEEKNALYDEFTGLSSTETSDTQMKISSISKVKPSKKRGRPPKVKQLNSEDSESSSLDTKVIPPKKKGKPSKIMNIKNGEIKQESKKKVKQSSQQQDEKFEKKVESVQDPQQVQESKKNLKIVQSSQLDQVLKKKAKKLQSPQLDQVLKKKMKNLLSPQENQESKKKLKIIQNPQQDQESKTKLEMAQSSQQDQEAKRRLEIVPKPNQDKEAKKKSKMVRSPQLEEEPKTKLKMVQSSQRDQESKKKLKMVQKPNQDKEVLKKSSMVQTPQLDQEPKTKVQMVVENPKQDQESNSGLDKVWQFDRPPSQHTLNTYTFRFGLREFTVNIEKINVEKLISSCQAKDISKPPVFTSIKAKKEEDIADNSDVSPPVVCQCPSSSGMKSRTTNSVKGKMEADGRKKRSYNKSPKSRLLISSSIYKKTRKSDLNSKHYSSQPSSCNNNSGTIDTYPDSYLTCTSLQKGNSNDSPKDSIRTDNDSIQTDNDIYSLIKQKSSGTLKSPIKSTHSEIPCSPLAKRKTNCVSSAPSSTYTSSSTNISPRNVSPRSPRVSSPNLSLLIPKRQSKTNLDISNLTNKCSSDGKGTCKNDTRNDVIVSKETSEILERWKNVQRKGGPLENNSCPDVQSGEKTYVTYTNTSHLPLPSIKITSANGEPIQVPTLRDLSLAVLKRNSFGGFSPQPPILNSPVTQHPLLHRYQYIDCTSPTIHVPPSLLPSPFCKTK